MKKILVNLKDWFDIKENISYSNAIKGLDFVLFPGMPYLFIYKDTGVVLGSQDVSSYESGAHTGTVSIDHLKEFGCKYVLLNHNELRIADDEILLGKVLNAIKNGVEAVVCINDSSEREIKRLQYIFENIDNPEFISIAYEPYEELSIDNITENLYKITSSISNYKYNSIIYGGNISKDNIAIFEQSLSVDGYLISRHALDIDELKRIIESVK